MAAGTSEQISVQVLNELAIFISLGVIPYIFYAKVSSINIKEIDRIKMIKAVLLETGIGLGLLFFYDYAVVGHFMIIAIAEELYFRVFQFNYLKEQLGVKKAIIISSVIFAFVLHMNDPILGNLLIRLPLGIVLCLIRYRFGVSKSIAAHWIYDVVVSMI